ncbi:MAG TPA: hypothetical protein VN814_14585 [Caulobacteraceae bacterium]|nr:hypothetical protein [Caulobacteraceae bacterium]
MSLSDLASLGSFVSGVAVLISLIFLYFQLRQVNEQVRRAERNQRATIGQVRASRTVQVVLHGTDPSIAQALQKAMTGDAELTITELSQFRSYARAFFVNTEDTFLQHCHGLLEDAAFRGYQASLSATFALAGYRVAWRRAREAFNPDYAAFIDQMIAETPLLRPPPSADQLAAWRSEIAEMSSNAA